MFSLLFVGVVEAWGVCVRDSSNRNPLMYSRQTCPNRVPPFELCIVAKNVEESGLAVAWVADEDVVRGHGYRVPCKRNANEVWCSTGGLRKSQCLSQAGNRVLCSRRWLSSIAICAGTGACVSICMCVGPTTPEAEVQAHCAIPIPILNTAQRNT